MVEYDDEDAFSYVDFPDTPVIYVAYLFMLLRNNGFDYAVGEA